MGKKGLTGGRPLGDVLGDITGSNRMAGAAQNAALEREREMIQGVQYAQNAVGEAQRVGGNMQAFGERAIAAASDPAELRILQESLNRQRQEIQNQEELFAAIDPAIMEASQQALKLMQGQDAAALDPMRRQRAKQRERLVANLREQMGPGAETSSAGIQALNDFDMQTDTLMAQTQQQTMGQLFGMGMQGQQAQAQGILSQAQQRGAGIGQMASIGQAFGAHAQRGADTVMQAGQLNLGAGQLWQGANSNLVQAQLARSDAAGAKYTADFIKGQAQNRFVNDRWNNFDEMFSGMMGGMIGSSDTRVKEQVESSEGDIDEMLTNLKPYSYNYIGGRARHYGVMAQDLEKSQMGSRYVINDAHGIKYVDYGKMMPALLSIIAHLNKKVEALSEDKPR